MGLHLDVFHVVRSLSMGKGRSTGVKIQRKPKSFYYVKNGRVYEKPAGRGGTARDTGKRVEVTPGHFAYVDSDGTVRETPRAHGGSAGARRSSPSPPSSSPSSSRSSLTLSEAKQELEAEWRREVKAGRTRLGYADWLELRRR